MKTNKIHWKVFGLILVASVFMFQSCSEAPVNPKNVKQLDTKSLLKSTPQVSLADFVLKTGNIITKKFFPPYIHAAELYYELPTTLVIDIRSKEEYKQGHIDGSYNVPRDQILKFLETKVHPEAYKKIVIVDKYGPVGIYAATLLRFYGYDNAYGLKFGIGAWNRKFANNIEKYLSNKYASKLDTVNTPKPQAGVLPITAKQPYKKILKSQVEKCLALPDSQIFVNVDDVFGNSDKYFKIAYWSEPKYNNGHIPGSIRYNTRSDLSVDKELNTLPVDKKIVVYCNTGHHAIATVAYLKLLGYDARSIMYGANSFMNQKFATDFPGSGITDVSLITAELPLVTGEKRSNKKQIKATASAVKVAAPVIPVHKKKKQAAAGGCE